MGWFISFLEYNFVAVDVVNALTGDRVWFHWDKEAATKNNKAFTIMETEKCLNPLVKPPPTDNGMGKLLL